jgi:hypothetical protein
VGSRRSDPPPANPPAQAGAELVERPGGIDRAGRCGGQQFLHGLLGAVIPDGFIAARSTVIIPVEIAGSPLIMTQQQVAMAVFARPFTDSVGERLQQIELTRMFLQQCRIQAQAIEMELLQPVQRIVDEELACDCQREVDAPAGEIGRATGEERRRVTRKVIALGPEVVTGDIKQDHQSLVVGGLDQILELVRMAITGGGANGSTPS